MSDNAVQDPALRGRATSLRFSGPVWTDRVARDQRDFVRQLAVEASDGQVRTELAATAAWLVGDESLRGSRSWSFSDRDCRIVGPGRWGYVKFSEPALAPPRAASGDELVVFPGNLDAPYLLEDGTVLVVPAGRFFRDSGSGVLTVVAGDGIEYFLVDSGGTGISVTAETDRPLSALVELARETAWFLRLPADYAPVALETARGELLEGSAFRCAPGWLVLRDNPWDLWPDGVAHATASLWTAPCARHRALRTDRLRGTGKHVAAYLRRTQSVTAMARAVAEVAGVHVFDNDSTVLRVFSDTRGFVHHLADGTVFVLPVDAGYRKGDLVGRGGIAGDLVAVRHLHLQGAHWWQARGWGAAGIDISLLRPGFAGFAIRDERIPAFSYNDNGLRARLYFNQLPVEETRYWAWQSRQEQDTGVETFARDVLGFTSAGQTKMVNPLEVWANMAGPWLTVLESPLRSADPGRWQETLDFIDRCKPAGSLVLLLPV